MTQRPETIVNPEGRGSEGSSHAPLASPVNSSVWQRLFPQAMGSSDGVPGMDPPSPEGFELGHFVLQERIGIGGMGAVFRALDTRLQRIVALKVLGPAQSRDESSVRRFQNEASAAARLDHDNIARVYYIGEDQGLHFIAFEYITGTNLRDLIRDGGPLSPMDAVNYTLQIAGALNHTYAAGVVHRDIKPSNIIIMPNGRAKLVDLGLARKQNSDSVAELTLAGTTLGTFDYISPEQAKDPRTADVRSDIYSLGCTLYHALTGSPPYPEGTVLQKLLDHQGKEAPDPILKNRHIPPDLSAICRKMMASDPKYRYATPEVLVRDLMPVAARMGLRGLPADGLIWRHITPPKESVWKRNFGWVASVSVLLLIVFVLWRFPSLGSGTNETPTAGTQTANSNYSPKFSKMRDKTGSRLLLPDENAPIPVPAPAKEEEEPVGPLEEGSLPETDLAKPPTIAEVLSTPDPENPRKLPFNMPSVIEEVGTEPDQIATNSTTQPPLATPVVPPIQIEAGSPKEEPVSPADPPMPAMVETELRPYWVIRNDGSQDEGKLTLEAACTAAVDGEIVEIRHNGLLPEAINKPIRIKNKNLTIRAGEDYRPLLKFSGVETPADGLHTRLFRLTNASVDLIDLDFHLAPQAAAMSDETWALVSLEGSGRVLLQGVTVTADQPERGLAAIVELLPSPTSQAVKDMKMMNQDTEIKNEAFEVRVSKSFIRGSCDMFLIRHTLPGRIELEQSALALEGALLKAEGNLEMQDENQHVELRLDHTTCIVGMSLIRMDSGDVPRYLLPVHVRNTRDNLIATNTSNTPLISMNGKSDLDVFERLLRWEGLKNFYDGFDVFWSISSNDFTSKKFEAWVQTWAENPTTKEESAQNGGFEWQGGWSRMDFLDVVAEDLMLDRQSDLGNPAVKGATDRTDVGADLSQLPPLPIIARDATLAP